MIPTITAMIPHKGITWECMGDSRLYPYMLKLSLRDNSIPVKIDPLDISSDSDMFITGVIPVEYGRCTVTVGVNPDTDEYCFICKWYSE